MEKAHENEDIVVGQITGKVKGGFTVSLQNVRAFLPGSLVDVRPVKDSAYLENRDLELKLSRLTKFVTTLLFHAAQLLKTNLVLSVKSCLRLLKKAKSLKVSLRTLLITVLSSTWAVSTVVAHH